MNNFVLSEKYNTIYNLSYFGNKVAMIAVYVTATEVKYSSLVKSTSYTIHNDCFSFCL